MSLPAASLAVSRASTTSPPVRAARISCNAAEKATGFSNNFQFEFLNLVADVQILSVIPILFLADYIYYTMMSYGTVHE